MGPNTHALSATSRNASLQEIYVSPTGSDLNPGTEQAPVATIQRAQAIVRSMNSNMRGDIAVYLEPGTYRLSSPLAFSARDSGTNGYDIVYTSAPDASTTISGGEQVTDWTLSNARENIWVATLPPNGVNTRQLYVDGMRANMATGYVRGKVTKTTHGFLIQPNPIAGWDTHGLEFVWLGSVGPFNETICPVASTSGDSVVMDNPCWDDSTRRYNNFVSWSNLGHPTYMQGSIHLLASPGQYYLDRAHRRIYYIPRPGQNMTTADAEVALRQALVTGIGTPKAPVKNIEFSNLTFAYATWLQPGTPEGLSPIQANFTLTGSEAWAREGLCHYAPHGTCPYGSWTKPAANLEFRFDRKITFSNDRFVRLGGSGLDLGDGSQGDTVEGSVFTDISANGLMLGGVDMPTARGASATTGITVDNNHFYGLPVDYEGGVPLFAGYVSNSVITHNLIEDVPYSAISIGWGGWPEKWRYPPQPNRVHGNVISDNRIVDFMQVMGDGGGIYSQGPTGTSMAKGMRVTGNVISGQLGWSRALHTDDGTAYVTYSHNVLYGNGNDWGVNHPDSVQPGNDPITLTDNYWEQGDPTTHDAGLNIAHNTVITGPQDAPASIVQNAGIQPAFQTVEDWTPVGQLVPSSPQLVRVLFAFRGSVYLTWKPGVNQGSSPITQYSIQACTFSAASQRGLCGAPVGSPVVIAAADFLNDGFAVVPGLHDGTRYSFQVTAWNGQGPSTPSVPTNYTRLTSRIPRSPGHPHHLSVKPASGGVVLQWWPPSGLGAHFDSFATKPVLEYSITSSNGQHWVASGLGLLYNANGGGRVMYPITGLSAGTRYRFSVAAVRPGEQGSPSVTKWVTPSG